MTPEQKAEARREFFELVERLERTGGPDVVIATSVAVMAVCRARLHRQPKPMIGVMKSGDEGMTEGMMGEAVRGAIDHCWPQYATWPPEALKLSIELCAEHLSQLGVDMHFASGPETDH